MPNPITASEPRYRHTDFDGPTLPETKKKQTGWSNGNRVGVVAANGVNSARGAFVTAGIFGGSAAGAAAVAGPAVTLTTSLVTLYLANAEGKELNDALKNDIAHQVTLRLAAKRLPEDYVRSAVESRLAGYDSDEGARKLLSASADRVMSAVIRDTGGLEEAQKMFGDAARDGLQFASIRGLDSKAGIEVYRQTNPAFRQRYDNDLAFHHGVDAGVWAGRPEQQHRNMGRTARDSAQPGDGGRGVERR